MTCASRPGSVGHAKTVNVNDPDAASDGSGISTYEPLWMSSCLPVRRPSIPDAISTCLKPGPFGFVSPWISRTSRDSYSGWSHETMNRIVSPGAAVRRSEYPSSRRVTGLLLAGSAGSG